MSVSRRVLAVAGAVVVLQLALAHRFGWHRDELYFLACAKRLAWGYVDQPPFTPALARAVTAVFGESLVALRGVSALANGGVVVLTALMARDLGGGRTAQVCAAVAAAVASAFLAVGHLFSTSTYDVLAWTAVCALAVHAVRTGRERLWVAVGLVAGVGLLNKHSVAFLLGALLVGMVVVPDGRRHLRSPWLWLGGVVTLLVWAPNLVWQAQHDWPVVDMSRSLREEGIEDANTFTFVPLQLVLVNPALTPVWIAGLVWLLRDAAGRAWRPFAVAHLVLVVTFVVTSGKPYYLVGMYPVLLAAGMVALDRRQRARSYVPAAVVVGVLSLPFALPVLPISVVGDGVVAELNPEHRESWGWPELAATVDRVREDDAVVFTGNYGEAGAVERFTDGVPVYSGHNNYWWWGPPPPSADERPVLAIGLFDDAYVDRYFAGCRRLPPLVVPADVPNEESHAGLWRCDRPRRPWAHLWPDLRAYRA